MFGARDEPAPVEAAALFEGRGALLARPRDGALVLILDRAEVALMREGAIYLRADPALAADLASAGAVPYPAEDAEASLALRYWRLPPELDGDAVADAVSRAVAAAQADAARPRRFWAR